MRSLVRACLALGLALATTLAIAQTAFRPSPGSTVSLSASTTSSSVPLAKIPSGGGTTMFRLYNAGASTVFVTVGPCSTVTATTSNLPLPSGAIEALFFDVSDTENCLAGVTASGTATLYVTTGAGG